MALDPVEHGLLYWYTSSAILGLCTLWNIISKVAAWYQSRSYASLHPPSPPRIVPAALAPCSPSSTASSDSTDEKHASSVPTKRYHFFPSAVAIAIRNTLLLTSIPVRVPILFRFGEEDGKRKKKYSWQYDIPVYEALWTFVYFAVVGILSFYGTAWDVARYTKTSAYICAAQMPMIIALAGKNNLVSFMTGITYEKLNFLHRAAGRCCLLTLWIHAFGRIAMVDGLSRKLWQQAYIYWGVIGLLAFTLLMVFSLRNLRHRFYEFFLLTHISLGALTIAGFWLHWPTISIWLYPGIALWAGDRLLRILRIVFLNRLWITKTEPVTPVDSKMAESSFEVTATPPPTQAHIHLLTPSTLLITLPATRLHWAAGQHLYVIMPTISRFPWEAHPFSAATAVQKTGANELVFVVRVRDGFTKRMRDAVESHQRATAEDTLLVPAAVEGPYGVGRELGGYDTVLLIAGGSGISFALAHLLQIVRDAKLGKGRVRDVRIIWMCKSRLHLNWISNILHQQLHSLPTNLTISLHIHVTKNYLPRARSLPCAPEPTHSHPSWQAVLKERTSSSRRRMSRIMSTMSWVTWGSHRSSESRRGSALSVAGGSKLTPTKKKVPKSPRQAEDAVEASDDEKSERSSTEVPPVSTFVWSEGYQGRDLPSKPDNAETFRASRRRASEAPSMGVLSEEEDDGPTGKPRQLQPSLPIRSDASSAGSSRRGSELISPLPIRITPSSSRRGSQPPQSLNVTLAEEDAGEAHSPRTPRSLRRSIALDRTRDVSPTRRISFDIPSETSRRGSEALPKKHSFSLPIFTQSFLKVEVEEQDGSTYLEPTETPSRELTPVKDSAGASFEQDEPLRRRASVGLESFVSWHEGRADLVQILTELQRVAHGSISVNVCGPRSLLNSSRDAVRSVSGPRRALEGSNRIDYYAETFGW